MKLKLKDGSIVNVNIVSENTRIVPGEEKSKTINISISDSMTYEELMEKFTEDNISSMILTANLDMEPVEYSASGNIRASISVNAHSIERTISIDCK